MLRLRSCIVSHLLSSPSTPLPRLLSAAAPAVSPSTGFAVEEYLVATCGLTRVQALKASPKISHLKSPSNPDAVLAFLAGLGLSRADVAAAVAKDPRLLCARVESTLAPNLAALSGIGLSRSEIVPLLRLRCRSVVSKLQYYLTLFGSSEAFLQALKFNCNLLTHSIEGAVEPNVALLRECGLGDRDIAKLCVGMPWLLTANPECIRSMVARADGLGVSRESPMFRHAMHAVAFHSEEKIAAKMEYLKKTLRWSDAEVRIALSKSPMMLRSSEGMVQRMSEFLISEMGLEPAYIAHRPAILAYSLERQIRPSTYALTSKLRRTLLKTMMMLAEDKCPIDSDLHEPRTRFDVCLLKVFLSPNQRARSYAIPNPSLLYLVTMSYILTTF
ncbi:uncharacterized protein LOC119291502 isoform X1 [Triticum dicoccoides]|uniref:uncharacterized protein LOC119291502 isoform X1 n=1 Tax=Triticum dicoccoides TaxID=85692 RepID=UPI00188EE769|nr:uncharacterized protein LOC119291502 isoform X1 [Triticum dicoccoides]